jgi:DNA mismatch endonuclease, patch repair protein
MPGPLNDETRRRMRRQGRRDTSPELAIRRVLYSLGFRYRVDAKPERALRCRGDIVFVRPKVVVFIDGCFWHGCPLHATMPKNNAVWWREKLEGNIVRDRRNDQLLRERGWTVLRLWEHVPVPEAVARVTSELERFRSGGSD